MGIIKVKKSVPIIKDYTKQVRSVQTITHTAQIHELKKKNDWAGISSLFDNHHGAEEIPLQRDTRSMNDHMKDI